MRQGNALGRPQPARPVETRPMQTRPVRTAVFPVAGLGTRFLPATKAVPKETLTLVDRPLIHYAVDEARAAGIETGMAKAEAEAMSGLALRPRSPALSAPMS